MERRIIGRNEKGKKDSYRRKDYWSEGLRKDEQERKVPGAGIQVFACHHRAPGMRRPQGAVQNLEMLLQHIMSPDSAGCICISRLVVSTEV